MKPYLADRSRSPLAGCNRIPLVGCSRNLVLVVGCSKIPVSGAVGCNKIPAGAVVDNRNPFFEIKLERFGHL